MAKPPKRTHTTGRGTAGSFPSAGSSLFELRRWQCIAALFGLVAVFFHQLLLGNAYLWEDFLYYSYPARSFAATSMAMGQMPLWNPYTFNGMPFFADILTTVFYLPCTALVFFVHNGSLNFYWLELVVILHYALAGVSMFLLAQSFGLRRWPSLFAAVSYMFAGFMVVHAIHQPVITLAAWIPLILFLFRKTIAEPSWSWVFLAALALGLSTFTGFPQLSLYIYSLLCAFFLFEVVSRARHADVARREFSSMALRVAACIGLSLALAAVQLLPTQELSALSKRAEISYSFSTEGSLAWPQLVTLVFPKIFGSSGAQGYHYYGSAGYWDYWETCIYFGVLPILLMILSIPLWKKSRYIAFFWGVAVFALLFALGKNFYLHRLLFDYIPGYGRFKSPARIGILLSFAGALLSGFTLQTLLYEESSRTLLTRLRRVLFITVAIGTGVWLLTVTGALNDVLPFLKNPEASARVVHEMNISLLVLLASGVVVVAMLKRGGWSRWVGLAAIGILFVDLSLFGGSQNNGTVNPATYFARATSIVNFLKQQGKDEIFRVNTRNAEGMVMDRNQGMIDRVFMMEGYDPLVLQRRDPPLTSLDDVYDLLNIKYKTITDEKARSLKFVPHPTYMPRAFFLYKIHVALSEQELVDYLKSPAFHHRTTAVIEKEPAVALGSDSTATRWEARITGYTNNAISLAASTERTGFLVLSEMYYPGWRAYVDGKETEIYRTDYNLRGFFVDAGTHAIDVRYEPATFAAGALVSGGALALCGAGIILSAVRKRRKNAAEKSAGSAERHA